MLPRCAQDYKSQRWVPIHYPGALLGDSLRRSVVADLPGLRLAREVPLLRDAGAYLGAVTAQLAGGVPGARLNLRLHNKVSLLRVALAHGGLPG
jgi:hypothetical protein